MSSASSKKILLITEGKSTEPKIFNQLKKAGLLSNNAEIVPYQNNIYALDYFIRDGYKYNDHENLDIKLLLLEKERKEGTLDEEKFRILDDSYTDILLIFDLEPHSREYSKDRILNLIKIFNTTLEGKLYLSYPMIEALFDITDSHGTFRQEDFNKKSISPKDIRRKTESKNNKIYKNFIKDKKHYKLFSDNKTDQKFFKDILKKHLKKAVHLMASKNVESQELIFRNIEDGNGNIYILSTALFYLFEEYPSRYLSLISDTD